MRILRSLFGNLKLRNIDKPAINHRLELQATQFVLLLGNLKVLIPAVTVVVVSFILFYVEGPLGVLPILPNGSKEAILDNLLAWAVCFYFWSIIMQKDRPESIPATRVVGDPTRIDYHWRNGFTVHASFVVWLLVSYYAIGVSFPSVALASAMHLIVTIIFRDQGDLAREAVIFLAQWQLLLFAAVLHLAEWQERSLVWQAWAAAFGKLFGS